MERPDLTEWFPAIDGIRNNHGEPIRHDVLKIINMDDEEFEKWYSTSKTSIRMLRELWGPVMSIPNLEYPRPEHQYDMTANTVMRTIKDNINKAEEHLELIKERREEERH
jgi:hypothetical protein